MGAALLTFPCLDLYSCFNFDHSGFEAVLMVIQVYAHAGDFQT